MQNAQQVLATGTLIRERYRVKSLIGRGASGAVYLVEDQRAQPGGQRVFALKEILGLSKQERVVLTFNSVALRQINHPALPKIYHVFNDEKRKRACLVMDFIDGTDAETLCQHQPNQRFGWPEVTQMLASVVDALAYLHHQAPPIVHGDVKPVNILLAEPGERSMLVDFGVRREAGSSSDPIQHSSGYRAPEQYGNSVDERADVYGLGATCYTLLTGMVPPNALERIACLDRLQTDPLTPLETVAPAVPVAAARAIHRTLSISPSERFASVEAFWEAAQATAADDEPAKSDAAPQTDVATPEAGKVSPAFAAAPLLLPEPAPSRQAVAPAALLRRFMIPFVLLAIFVLVSVFAGLWALTRGHTSQVAGGTAITTASQARAAHTPGLTGTQGPFTAPTSSPGTYPSLLGSYAGTLANVPTRATPPLLFQVVLQLGGKISGFFTVGAPFSMSGPFQGTIDHARNIQFTVMDANGQPFLFLEGAPQPGTFQNGTYLSGDFYSCAKTPAPGGGCAHTNDAYGLWTVKSVVVGG